MVNHSTFQMKPTFQAPRNRVVLWTVMALGLALLAAVVVLSASANPPSAAEVRMAGLISELQEPRLTAQRQSAQQELESAGEQAVPALTVALRSSDATLRRNAADMLGFIASPSSASALEYSLANDTDSTVRRNAAYALGEVKSFATFGDLQRASLLDRSIVVRQAAQDSLARLHTRIALSSGINDTNLNAFAIAPSNTNTIYAAAGRDLKRTTDGGATWNTFTSALASLTDTLAVSPKDPQTLYAGVNSLGIYKSTDGGRTWAAMNNGLPTGTGVQTVISAITIDPANADHVLIATSVRLGTSQVEFVSTGILQTMDGGATWNLYASPKQGQPVTQMLVKDNQLYALAGNQVLIYRLG